MEKRMARYVVSADAGPEELEPVVMCIHELVNRLPVTARSKGKNGIRVEGGRVLDRSYTGPVLEDAIRENRVIKTTPGSGQYRGIPVIVSPIRNGQGEVMGAIGIVDITGIFDLATLMEHHSAIIRQVCGTDPCPLPTESVGGKR